MASKLLSTRNPYPFPQLQNDENFVGCSQTEKLPYSKPTHLAQHEEPWNRLNSKCTLSSSRREVFNNDPEAPDDSLDFVLKAKYNHHKEFQKAKNEVLIQPETVGEGHDRKLKNRAKVSVKEAPALNHPLDIYVQPNRESVYSIKNAIESPHSAATNGGYSRKHDGGFYCT